MPLLGLGFPVGMGAGIEHDAGALAEAEAGGGRAVGQDHFRRAGGAHRLGDAQTPILAEILKQRRFPGNLIEMRV